MALRAFALGLAILAWTACGKDDTATDTSKPAAPAATVDLDKRCIQLGKICGDKGKHVDKIVAACSQLGKQQAAKGCADKANAAYDCYERELCAKADKVWAFEDLDVLAERHGKCVAERDAARTCTGK